MFIPTLALLAMRSIYIGQLLRPAAVPLIVHMRVILGGVAMVCDYPHPTIQICNLFQMNSSNLPNSINPKT